MQKYLFDRYASLYHTDGGEDYQLREGVLEEVGNRNGILAAYRIMRTKAKKAVAFDGIRASSLDKHERDMFT